MNNKKYPATRDGLKSAIDDLSDTGKSMEIFDAIMAETVKPILADLNIASKGVRQESWEMAAVGIMNGQEKCRRLIPVAEWELL